MKKCYKTGNRLALHHPIGFHCVGVTTGTHRQGDTFFGQVIHMCDVLERFCGKRMMSRPPERPPVSIKQNFSCLAGKDSIKNLRKLGSGLMIKRAAEIISKPNILEKHTTAWHE